MTFRASEFRMVLALKIIQNRGWRNTFLTSFAEVALTNKLIVESDMYSHLELLGIHKWEDLVELDKKKLDILISETYEYLGHLDKALEVLKTLLGEYPKDEGIKKKLRTLEKTMQTLRGRDSGEEVKASS